MCLAIGLELYELTEEHAVTCVAAIRTSFTWGVDHTPLFAAADSTLRGCRVSYLHVVRNEVEGNTQTLCWLI